MPTPSPSVTVIVTTFGRPALVAQAVRSVLGQTMADWELLVVDDNPPGSAARQGTIEALAEAGRDPRVRHVLRSAPGGGSAARNTGVAMARAPWVAFLDDDDAWDADKLDAQLRLAADDPAVALVYAGYRVVDGAGKVVRTVTPRHVGREYPALLGENVIGTTSTILCRKDVLDEVGGFDEALPAAQDRDLYLRVCRGRRAAAVLRPLATFRLHAGSRISHDRRGKARAYARLLHKYTDAYDRHPRAKALLLRQLGQLRWLTGDGVGARHDLLRALRHGPLDARAWGLWCLSWLSAERYLAVYGSLAPGRVTRRDRLPREP